MVIIWFKGTVLRNIIKVIIIIIIIIFIIYIAPFLYNIQKHITVVNKLITKLTPLI